MTLAQTLLPEFDQEMATTRRLLERVPSDRADWKPHPKSFSLAHLAQLVAGMPGWFTGMIDHPTIDLAKAEGYSNKPTETLLEIFDDGVRRSRKAIENADDARFAEDWSLSRGGQVLMTQSRFMAVRTTVSHLAHHRGQLTVYLRMLDVPIPSIYGPTADEKAF
jgi:uncharacterized damage-inducible protein DinB